MGYSPHKLWPWSLLASFYPRCGASKPPLLFCASGEGKVPAKGMGAMYILLTPSTCTPQAAPALEDGVLSPCVYFSPKAGLTKGNVGQSPAASEEDGGRASPRQGGTCRRTPLPPSPSTYQPKLCQGWEWAEAGERERQRQKFLPSDPRSQQPHALHNS